MAKLLGRGAYSRVYRLGDQVFKPFDVAAQSIKTDQLIQFRASKTQLEEHGSALADHVGVATVWHRDELVEAIVMPYTGARSLDRSEAWSAPTISQLIELAVWMGSILHELQRCRIIMLDWKLANILYEPTHQTFDLCDWDSLVTEEDATNVVDQGICPVAAGTYSPYHSTHPAVYTVVAMRYATEFSAAVTLIVAKYGKSPKLERPPTAKAFLARHQAIKALLCSFLPSSPPWFSSPTPVLKTLARAGFFSTP